jgi:hypothetical protein
VGTDVLLGWAFCVEWENHVDPATLLSLSFADR